MSDQAITQTLGVLAVCGWSAIATLVLVWIVRKTVGLRVSPETIDDGLDMAVHGEKAYRSIN
jgi:Amt family ammonium transporter